MGLISAETYIVRPNDSFFFDTNVWLLLFGDIAGYQSFEQSQYSNILKSILDRGSSIFITSAILSEFANVLLRKSFNEWCLQQENIGKGFKKDYVGTEVYSEQVKFISEVINKIIELPCIIRMPDDFNSLNLTRVLANFKSIDFNDAYIAEICQSKSLHLITNDRDFFLLENNLNIISALV